MVVLVAGADGRLGGLLVASLLGRGHAVRALVRRRERAGPLEDMGATPLVGDLRGDVEWTADRCEAAIFAAGARHRAELAAIDGGGAVKLAEAATRFDLRRFVLCSAVGADAPELHKGPLCEFLAAKHAAERRLKQLEMPWTILRFGRLTDAAGNGRITTTVPPRTPVTLRRDDAALAIVEALDLPHLARRVVHVVDGDRRIAEALDAVEPGPLPPVRNSGLGAGQAQDPPADPEMLFPDASPLDAAVEYEGEGPLLPEIIDNDDPAPGVP